MLLRRYRRRGEPAPAAPAALEDIPTHATTQAQLRDAEQPRRKRRRRKGGDSDAGGALVATPSADTIVAAGHINFFADMERQLEADGTARNVAKDAQNPAYLVRSTYSRTRRS